MGNSTTAQDFSSASGLVDSAATFVSSLTGGPAATAAQSAASKLKGTQGAQADLVNGTQPTLDLTQKIENYAEIHVYEPQLKGGVVTWVELKDLNAKFERNVVGVTPSQSPGSTPGSAAASPAQVLAKVKGVTVADGAGGGMFTIASASIDASTHQVSVVLGTNGKAMGKTYASAGLVAIVEQKVCGVLPTTVKVGGICLVHVDVSKITGDLK